MTRMIITPFLTHIHRRPAHPAAPAGSGIDDDAGDLFRLKERPGIDLREDTSAGPPPSPIELTLDAVPRCSRGSPTRRSDRWSQTRPTRPPPSLSPRPLNRAEARPWDGRVFSETLTLRRRCGCPSSPRRRWPGPCSRPDRRAPSDHQPLRRR